MESLTLELLAIGACKRWSFHSSGPWVEMEGVTVMPRVGVLTPAALSRSLIFNAVYATRRLSIDVLTLAAQSRGVVFHAVVGLKDWAERCSYLQLCRKAEA